MAGSDRNQQPDLAEVLASIRRITAVEAGSQWGEPFQLPAVFRPDRTPVADTGGPRLVNKLSELLRKTAVPPVLPELPHIEPAGGSDRTGVDQVDCLSTAPAEDRIAATSPAARPAFVAQPVMAPSPYTVTPRFRILLAEQALHELNDVEVRLLVGELLLVAASRSSCGNIATAEPDCVGQPDVPVAAAPVAERPAIESLVADLLRPMLREWLVVNMSATVERALASELHRMFGQSSRPPRTLPSDAWQASLDRLGAARLDPHLGAR